MFSSLKNFTIATFALLVFLSVVVSLYYKNAFIQNVIKVPVDQQSELLIDTYQRVVWNKYYPVIAYLYTMPNQEWGTLSQYSAYIEESKLFLQAQNLIKATIVSEKGQLLYDSASTTMIEEKSTTFNMLFSGKSSGDALKEAVGGKNSSVVLVNAEINGPLGRSVKSMLKTYAPLKVSKILPGTEDAAASAKAVLEINIDITDVIAKVQYMQYTLIFIIVAALSVLTAAIFIAVQRAEKVIEKQQEASMEMAAAKASAESESRAKSQFLANVSHELRTPLNAIIGFSEIINSESMGPIGNPQYKEFIGDIHTSGVHLLSLINDILDFSKAEENKLQVDFEQVDVTKLAKVCMRMVLPRAETSKVHLQEDLPPEHLVFMADQKRLKQVILNLLSNAVKFTPEGGQVTLKVWKDIASSAAVVEVKDSGVGMAPQDLARALAPFGQVDNKLSRRYEGTGLGLPLTKKLVELMKGKFDIRSEVGLGTTVTLTFSLLDSEMGEIGPYHNTPDSGASTPTTPPMSDATNQ